MPAREFAKIISLKLKGELPIDELISDRIALADINAASGATRQGEATRIIIQFEEAVIVRLAARTETSLRVAAMQWEPARGDIAANWAVVDGFLADMAGAPADLVVLPEMALTGYLWRNKDDISPLAISCSSPDTQSQWVKTSRRYNAWIVVGHPAVDATSGTLRNRCTLVSPDGIVGYYDKTCLFVEDTHWAHPGNRVPPVWDTPWGGVSPVICADVDYPEPMSSAVARGARLVVLPTAWVSEPAPSATWTIRAAEYGVPVVAADLIGGDGDVVFPGGSCIIGPDGTITAAIDAESGVVVADLVLADAVADGGLGGANPWEKTPCEWPLRLSTGEAFGRPGDKELTVAVWATGTPEPDGETTDVPEGDIVLLPTMRAGTAADRRERENAITRLSEERGAIIVAGTLDASTSIAEVVLARPGVACRVVARAVATPDGLWRNLDGVTEATTFTVGDITVAVMGAWGLADHRPLRALATSGAHLVVAAGPSTLPPSRYRPRTMAPLLDGLGEDEEWFAHPARFRAGESNVWLAFSGEEPENPSGVFSANHVWWPRREVLGTAPGWVSTTITVDTGDPWGSEAVWKPLLSSRRLDLYPDGWKQ